jgi:2-polyprenyl-3-methyl-5-hydroxy-6-metoxy-1,4-benzoquinol methylase
MKTSNSNSSNHQIHPIDPCQICGSKEGDVVMTKKRGRFTSTWVECKTCRSAHIDPYPDAVELAEYYDSGYTDMDFADTADHQVNHKLRYSSEYETTIFSEYRFSLIDAGLVPENLPGQFKRILDYGCANGVFLRFLNTLGVTRDNLYGCDISSQLLESCRDITDNLKPASNVFEFEEKFDLITLWDVIEHIHEPLPVISTLTSLLSPNGEILIQTPNYGILANLLGSDYAHYLAVEHINLFSRNALIEMFKNVGMNCVSASSFGANVDSKQNQTVVKSTFDKMAKLYDFGATQVLRFRFA